MLQILCHLGCQEFCSICYRFPVIARVNGSASSAVQCPMQPTSSSTVSNQSLRLSRRQFLRVSSLATGAAVAWPALFTGCATHRGRPRALSPNEKLNVAIIGVGGRGGGNLGGVSSENIVALCDVFETPVLKAAERFPRARKFKDFRRVFDHANEFDAVVVSTCEHTHAFATMLALQHGKHVYCEKPLTHNIWEARRIREAAAKAKVATQMGIQIHATENYRQVVELVQSGIIGSVHEAHVWVSRAWGWQSEADA